MTRQIYNPSNLQKEYLRKFKDTNFLNLDKDQDKLWYILNNINLIAAYWQGEFQEYTKNPEWLRIKNKFFNEVIFNNIAYLTFYQDKFYLATKRNEEYFIESNIKIPKDQIITYEWPIPSYFLLWRDVFDREYEILTTINTLNNASAKKYIRYVNTADPDQIIKEDSSFFDNTTPWINLQTMIASSSGIESQYQPLPNIAQELITHFDILMKHFNFKADRLGYYTATNNIKSERLTEGESTLLNHNTNNLIATLLDSFDLLSADIEQKFNITLLFRNLQLESEYQDIYENQPDELKQSEDLNDPDLNNQ